jgi:hypothetical protein
MPTLIINDRSISAAEERDNLPFTRRNADAGGTWRFESRIPLTLSAGYGWERWKRSEARNVADLREGSPRVSLDVGLFDWMSLRSSYTTGRRRIRGEYIQNTTTDLPLHRRFDQADRDRQRSTLIATLTPLDQLSVSGTWTIGHDEYPNSAYGLQSDRNNMAGADVSWAVTDRFSVDGSLTNENFLTRLRSKYRVTGQLDLTTRVPARRSWTARRSDPTKHARNPTPAGATETRYASARTTAAPNPTGASSASMTRMPAAILPIVCPPAAVKSVRYPPATSPPRSASGLSSASSSAAASMSAAASFPRSSIVLGLGFPRELYFNFFSVNTVKYSLLINR